MADDGRQWTLEGLIDFEQAVDAGVEAPAVLRDEVLAAAARIEEADRQALRDAGFSDRDIWDIAAVTGFFNMSNRLAQASDMRPNREYHYQMRERPER